MKGIRNSYKVIIRKYRRIKKGHVRLTQSSLFLVQPIVPTTSRYRFAVLDSDTPVLAKEIRLNINDEFITYDVAYNVLGDLLDPVGVVGNFHHTYAPVELDASFAGIQGAWNGRLSILVNKISRLENWDMKKHNKIQRTQWANASAAVTIINAAQPSVDFAEDGGVDMQPMLTISGAKKTTIDLELDAAIVATATGAWVSTDTTALTITATELAFYFRGMLAQNASVFQK